MNSSKFPSTYLTSKDNSLSSSYYSFTRNLSLSNNNSNKKKRNINTTTSLSDKPSSSLSPSLGPIKSILTPGPIQSLTVQISDCDEGAKIYDDEYLLDYKIDTKTNDVIHVNPNSHQNIKHFKDWSSSREIYHKQTKLELQEKYIENLSKEIEIKSIFIMDFDDTIFPTSAYNILKKQSGKDNFWQFIDSCYNKYPVLSGFVAIINKCIMDTFNFMMKQINDNNSIILIISNGNYQWLNQCMNASKIISNLNSVKLLKNAINDDNIPIKLISAKSEFGERKSDNNLSVNDATKRLNKKQHRKSRIMRKQKAFIKYLNEIKKTNIHENIDTFCVYCIGDDDSEFEASKIAMNNVFGNFNKNKNKNKNKNNPYLLIRNKLDIDKENVKTILESVLLNIDSFHCWDKEVIIDMILQNKSNQIVYDIDLY